MTWWGFLVQGAFVLLAAALGFAGAMWTTERQSRHQVDRDRAAAEREYASRADEHFRPYIYELLSACRTINGACAAWVEDVGDIAKLDQCIDRLASSAIARDVAAAATNMRAMAIDFQGAIRLRNELRGMMPPPGGPLRPDVGEQVVAAQERASAIRDDALAATLDVHNAVNRLTADLEARRRGGAAAAAIRVEGAQRT